MNPTDDWDQELESMLRKPLPYVNDDGFTASVVGKLPPRRASKWRPAVLAISAVLAAGAAFLLPVGTFLPETLVSAATIPRHLSMLPLVSWLVVALIVWGAVGLATSEDA